MPGVQLAAAGTHPGLLLLLLCTPPSHKLIACHCCCCFPLLQMWHWGEKRRLAQYYSELYAREKAEEDAYTDELRAKLKALEEELLA